MPRIRKIRVHRILLSSGRELVLEEKEAIEIGDALLERALVGASNQRRLAFGDIALENLRPSARLRPALAPAARSNQSTHNE